MTTRIIGTGSYAPERIVTNDDLSKFMDTDDEWIRSRSGIRERRISTGESTSDLASKAAELALEHAGVSSEEIDIIIVATSTADYCLPCAACDVQAAIGAVNAVAYDISAACSGFVFALNTVHGFIKSGIYKTGLIIGVDVLSRIMNWSDRGTCVLFGDGGGAAVVRAEETGGIQHMIMGSDGTKGPVLECGSKKVANYLTGIQPQTPYVTMDGKEVFKFAVKKVPSIILQVLEEGGVKIDDIRYFILHQANSRIFESISKRLNISMDRIPMNLDRYANTSAGTIPLILDELNRGGKLNRGDKLVIAGFGAGLTWGATLLEW